MITVIQQGACSTIQDSGRWGYQAYGMPIAGAMDNYAYRLANLLAGNNENAAVIEMTGEGAAFKFDEEQFIAICGADMQATINNTPVENWQSLTVPRRGELRFSKAISGYRTYLAVRGGFDVPVVLGSRSTYVRAKIGGYEGRALRQGDVLYIGRHGAVRPVSQRIAADYIPQYTTSTTLRTIAGPQENMFSAQAVETFLRSSYTVDERSDRTGCQLQGAKILTGGPADIVSDAISQGAVQIPSYGMPFIVTADHGTTRGFAKIAYVIQADLPKLAQAAPADTIRFARVTEPQALEALEQQEQVHARLKALLAATFKKIE